MSKKIYIWGVVFLVVLADQVLKYYIKTHFLLGDHISVFGEWFQLYFVENPGMAYGWKFGGEWGKLLLTVFRLCAVVFGVFYLIKISKSDKYHKGFVLCAAFIFAGALGNLIDSCFYGLLFDKGMVFNPNYNEYLGYDGLATLTGKGGYASFLHGNVVDMLYFPVLRGNFPDWVPGWGGQEFEFFRPVFNIADAAISLGVIALMLFQKKFFPENQQESIYSEENSTNLQ